MVQTLCRLIFTSCKAPKCQLTILDAGAEKCCFTICVQTQNSFDYRVTGNLHKTESTKKMFLVFSSKLTTRLPYKCST